MIIFSLNFIDGGSFIVGNVLLGFDGIVEGSNFSLEVFLLLIDTLALSFEV